MSTPSKVDSHGTLPLTTIRPVFDPKTTTGGSTRITSLYDNVLRTPPPLPPTLSSSSLSPPIPPSAPARPSAVLSCSDDDDDDDDIPSSGTLSEPPASSSTSPGKMISPLSPHKEEMSSAKSPISYLTGLFARFSGYTTKTTPTTIPNVPPLSPTLQTFTASRSPSFPTAKPETDKVPVKDWTRIEFRDTREDSHGFLHIRQSEHQVGFTPVREPRNGRDSPRLPSEKSPMSHRPSAHRGERRDAIFADSMSRTGPPDVHSPTSPPLTPAKSPGLSMQDNSLDDTPPPIPSNVQQLLDSVEFQYSDILASVWTITSPDEKFWSCVYKSAGRLVEHLDIIIRERELSPSQEIDALMVKIERLKYRSSVQNATSSRLGQLLNLLVLIDIRPAVQEKQLPAYITQVNHALHSMPLPDQMLLCANLSSLRHHGPSGIYEIVSSGIPLLYKEEDGVEVLTCAERLLLPFLLMEQKHKDLLRKYVGKNLRYGEGIALYIKLVAEYHLFLSSCKREAESLSFSCEAERRLCLDVRTFIAEAQLMQDNIRHFHLERCPSNFLEKFNIHRTLLNYPRYTRRYFEHLLHLADVVQLEPDPFRCSLRIVDFQAFFPQEGEWLHIIVGNHGLRDTTSIIQASEQIKKILYCLDHPM